MARKKLSEFKAKNILYKVLGQEYYGQSLDSQSDWRQAVSGLGTGQYVIKVDQAEKGRFKKGLVKLDRSREEILQDAEELFASCLIANLRNSLWLSKPKLRKRKVT